MASLTASRLDVFRAALLVLVTSCATLVLELAAARLLAPFIGASLHTWTSIIGVVLAGISLGSYAGGRLSERGASFRWLAGLTALGAVLALLPLGWVAVLGDGAALRAIPVLPRTFLLTFLGFFPVSFVLAMVTPLALRLLLPDLARAGRIGGLLYALGTLGGLAGNFLTGFVLVAWFPVPTIVLTVAGTLLLCALMALPKASVIAPPVPATPSSGDGVTLEAPRAGVDLRTRPVLACFVVACASFCTLAIELAASRILAPTVGVSLLSWTGIIGVVLMGMALGNFVGGHLADRWPRQGVLAGSLLAAAASCLLIPPVHQWLVVREAFEGLGLQGRIVAYTAAVFLVPVTALGTLSPQVLRLALSDLGQAGRTVGRLSAWSTAGALLGSFLTGWWLIAAVGVYPLVVGASLGLVALAAFVGQVWRTPRLFGATAGTLALAGVFGSLGLFASPCTEETDYFCIKVNPVDYQGRKLLAMQLDQLTHTLVDLKDPSYLGNAYCYIHSEVVRHVATRTAEPRMLMIGGGGYVVPRWVETYVPQVRMEVVEIDPAVTRIALERFGVKPDTRIASFSLDGRQYLQEMAERGAYDLIIQDAVNDLSVPYHLVTREYDELVRSLLKPDGIYLLTVIDEIPRGAFLRAAIRTVQAVFPHVEVLHDARGGSKGQGVYIVAGSRQPMELERLPELLKGMGIERPRTGRVPRAEIDAYLSAGPALVLTDDFAPVDNLLAELFLLREQVAP
ncbi:Spermidine synthase [Myxococcus hansupus]|uniref:Spermidine synthase n=1 Tax=Pseudomyxococcus hansupus TaxID=1297742 RepID=A0A0H4XHW1_9BACT|nr:fused MFS/spermidine synthase [Myxococcus hansupus]AKQ67842.1 Spermidine synthase [Myxococcus hansupus]